MSFNLQSTEDSKPEFMDTETLRRQSSVDSEKDEKVSNTSTSTVMYSMDNEINKADECIKESSENLCNFDASPTGSGNSSPRREKNAEDEKLDQLLRLASRDPIPVKRSYLEEKSNFEKEDSQKRARNKTPEVTLIDCFNSQELCEETGECFPEYSKKDEDLEKQFNNEVKNLFLFSSESCQSDDGTESEKEKPTKEKKIRVKKVDKNNENAKKIQKRRKDDLQKYRISSSEDEEEGKASEKKKEGKNKMPMKEEERKKKEQTTEKEKKIIDDEDCDIISDSGNSVEVLMNSSDSDSEVVQINEIPASSFPVKGRKNIKRILDVKNLQLETKQALKMETERKRRLKERQELIKELCEKQDQGSKLILDFDPKTMKELVVVDENLSKHLKAHQREGIRFMWNCCFESLTRLKDEKGSGCVLAHCMGLGKTLQVITLIHSVLNHSVDMRTVLIVCPLITLKNWFHEFEIWMKGCKNQIIPFDLGPAHKKNFDQLELWRQKGGVLILSYDMFRSLTKKVCFSFCKKYLLDPGPDIVVCDEGHLMKNPNSGLSTCMSKIRTLRRIVLTGTPLQNNLIEYYCMVQFVKPNLLGTKTEFLNRFVNPITNGQFENSTQRDVHIMKQRSHVLHALLESFVQRLGYNALEPLLPEKQEFAISIALTERQDETYNACVKEQLKKSRGLLWDFHWFHKVWTHPYTLKNYLQKNLQVAMQGPWMKFFTEEDYGSIQSSNKLVLFFNILKKCRQIGDKVLVFSHSLFTLNLIENFLFKLNSDHEKGRESEFADSWVLGKDYFKLTGAVKYRTRESYFKSFSTSERARLFLISTKTGGLGINLVAANRVILFDASWNPAQDLQSIFRVYRFGQKKPCYIYRFLAAATMEEKIYKRQVTKLSLAHRILDEHQIERHYSSHNLQELYTYDPIPKSEWKIPKIPKDEIFAEILSNNRDIIVSYHEHNSLLENKEEEELTEEERKAAWENYEKEKTSPQKSTFERNFQTLQRSTVHIANLFGTVFNPPEITEILRNENENQQFTGFGSGQKPNGFQGSSNLQEVGNLLGLKPNPGEKAEAFGRRVQAVLQNIYPWGTPKIIIQGDVTNDI